jgi:hypothetical protein
MASSSFLAIAKDPAIIPGVHHHCDEWCDYCAVTARCLAFRCTDVFRREHGRADTDPTFSSMEEAIAFTRAVAEVEGTSTPELDALVTHGAAGAGMQTSDRLAAIACDYAVHVAMAFAPIAPLVANAPVRPGGPEPEEVLLWYHVRIYLRTVRALVAREGRAPGGDRTEDAIGSAKLVLVAVRRSRAAAEALQAREPADDFTELLSMLDALERGLDERFPEARAYLRVGLDVLTA